MQIHNGAMAIDRGMSVADVKARMGEPDEIHPIFDKDNWNKQIGIAYVYLLQRRSDRGSIIERDEHLVRITFDIVSENVDEVVSW
jgi:hypothetical protein